MTAVLRPTALEAAYDAQFDRPLPVIDLRGKPCPDPWCPDADAPRHTHPDAGRTVPLCYGPCGYPVEPGDVVDLNGLPFCQPCADLEVCVDGPDRTRDL